MAGGWGDAAEEGAGDTEGLIAEVEGAGEDGRDAGTAPVPSVPNVG